MKKIVIWAFYLLCLSSCFSQKSMTFKTHDKNYSMALPVGYKVEKFKGTEGIKEYHAIYSDSSVIFITNDTKSGSIFNKMKVEKYGQGVYLKIATSDSLTIEGEYKTEKFWKEIKLNKIVIGYINVSKMKKAIYDKVLLSLNSSF